MQETKHAAGNEGLGAATRAPRAAVHKTRRARETLFLVRPY